MTDQTPARWTGVSMPVAYIAVLVAALLAVSVLGAVWMMSHKSPQTDPREVTCIQSGSRWMANGTCMHMKGM